MTGLSAPSADAILKAILASMQQTLYDHQEEAILALCEEQHVFLKTPTGSGKSLVAQAAHHKALLQRIRSFYTSPIKALVSEKFFALINVFGAENVGMQTGDVSINPKANIVCCTAEILAALGLDAQFCEQPLIVCMDEFHYFGDKERGVYWQLPLLTLRRAQFLTMSATMGDTTWLQEGLSWQSQRKSVVISSHQRPVPLHFHYCEQLLHELLQDIIGLQRTPAYVVFFTQKEAMEQAQNCTSINLTSKDEKQQIKHELTGMRFDTPFGNTMRRLVQHGIGLHHAGLLPKYRLLVERLSQKGLLKVIMGTDTLGVGINIPIKSVVFTKLCKFDGETTAILSNRHFQQIAGRAGRKGYDELGYVYALAPAHLIENKRLQSRNQQMGKKKVVLQKPPEKNFVAWDEQTFVKLQQPKFLPLQSQFSIGFALVFCCLQNRTTGYRYLLELIAKSFETIYKKKKLVRQAAHIARILKASKLLIHQNHQLVVSEGLRADFSLHNMQTLFFLFAAAQLDSSDPSYDLHLLSLVESILENPLVILNRQKDKLYAAKLAELRGQDISFEQRNAELEKITYDKPDADFIYEQFERYGQINPLVRDGNVYPKSIARDMYERYASFNEYVKEYQLERSEGVLLRYLNQVDDFLSRCLPAQLSNEATEQMCSFFKCNLQNVDNSLWEAWQTLQQIADSGATLRSHADTLPPPPPRLSRTTVETQVRLLLYRFCDALAAGNYAEACTWMSEESLSQQALLQAMIRFREQCGQLRAGKAARQKHLSQISHEFAEVKRVKIRHTLVGEQEGADWFLLAEVCYLTAEDLATAPLHVTYLGD